MHQILIKKAYEEARRRLIQEGNLEPSNFQLAQAIESYLNQECGVPLSSKSIDNYRKTVYKDIGPKDQIIKQKKVIDGFCDFLGYESYEEFCHQEELKEENCSQDNPSKKSKKRGCLISIVVFSMVSISILGIKNYLPSEHGPKWMKWNKDHYEEVPFNASLVSNGTLKLYKEERIKHFRKVTIDSSTAFFAPNGDVQIWYGKNSKGDLECFSSYGLHPETGKTLKPITRYMINKYFSD